MTTETAQDKLACAIMAQYQRRKEVGQALALKLREECPHVQMARTAGGVPCIDPVSSTRAAAYNAAIDGIDRWISEEYKSTRSAIDGMGFLEDFFGE